MAIRKIRLDGSEVLRKKSKEIKVITNKILTLLDDMAETMYKADGVGLAAPQVGILKRLVVIDTGDGLIELINPQIIEEQGEVTDSEGCLSIPEYIGEVKRPEKVTAMAFDRKGRAIRVQGEGLLARALCHEIDHLDGILFKDKAITFVKKPVVGAGDSENK